MVGHPVDTGRLGPAHDSSDAWSALIVLTAIYSLNIADRFIVSTLMESIKAEFQLSDSMVGFLTGTVLALFFVLTTYPIGVLTDRFNRKSLIAAFASLFSVMTVACGLAVGTVMFAAARIGVGVAEAGTSPPSLSLLADKFSPSRRAMAMTTFTVGAALGGAAGSGIGGWLSASFGWRMALIVFGVAGFPLLLLLFLLVREPKRGALDPVSRQDTPSVSETLAFIWHQKSLVHVMIGGTVVSLWGWGLMWWAPAFFHRSFGMSVSDVGETLGWIHLIGGTGAILITAFVMRLLASADARVSLALIAAIVALATIPSIVAVTTGDRTLSIAMTWLYIPVVYLYFGPNFALINNLVPAQMRGQAIAIYLLATNFANLAVAPQIVGFVSDIFGAQGYSEAASLRLALIGLSVTGFWGALHFFLALPRLRRDLDHAQYAPAA